MSCILSAQMRVIFFPHTNQSDYFKSSCASSEENDCTYIIQKEKKTEKRKEKITVGCRNAMLSSVCVF